MHLGTENLQGSCQEVPTGEEDEEAIYTQRSKLCASRWSKTGASETARLRLAGTDSETASGRREGWATPGCCATEHAPLMVECECVCVCVCHDGWQASAPVALFAFRQCDRSTAGFAT